MKVFLIGPISHGGTLPLDKVHVNVMRFEHYARRLKEFGYEPIHEAVIRKRESDRISWEAALKRSILRMLSCDAVYLLPGWQRSRGARLETMIAGELGMTILTIPLEDNGSMVE